MFPSGSFVAIFLKKHRYWRTFLKRIGFHKINGKPFTAG